MCRASPSTTVSVTLTSGCSEVPDFSAYLRAYAHILSMLACAGLASSLMRVLLVSRFVSPAGPPLLRQRGVDRVGVEAGQALVADEDDRQRHQAELHQLLARSRILPDV